MDEYPIIDLSHLLPAAQGLARLPADERIQRLRADRWIGYPRAVEALNRLEALYAWPNKQRMPNLLLVGPTNNGKSMIVEKFRRTHPASSDADQEHIPVLVVQMPSEPSVIRFYVALLAAMGAPLRPRPRLPEMEQLALALLRKVGVRMLVIDELHNVLAGNSVNRREFLNLLRFLGNELRIPLVGVGTRDAYLAIRSDDQLENRFEPMMLPVWEANDDCCSLLASFAASLPLRRPSPIATLDMARYLLTRSEGTIGELAHLLMAAAIVAVESGEEAINHRTLSMATGSGSSAIGRKTTPDVGKRDEAAPMTVMPKSCPTIDSNVPRPTSNLRIEGAGQIPARRKTIWSCTCGPVPPCLTMNVSAARSAHVAAERPTRACRADTAAKRGSVHIRREWQSGGLGVPATNAISSRSARSCVRVSRAVPSVISMSRLGWSFRYWPISSARKLPGIRA